jgi:hypothetical protein
MALRFEWTWQHPTEAKRLNFLDWAKLFKENDGPRKFRSHIQILKEMLSIKPWLRVGLRVCVTSQSVKEMLDSDGRVSASASVYLGKLSDLQLYDNKIPEPDKRLPSRCALCSWAESPPPSPANWVVCPFCKAFLHLRCLAQQFISQAPGSGSALIPTTGFCPACHESLVWRDIVEMRNQMDDEL